MFFNNRSDSSWEVYNTGNSAIKRSIINIGCKSILVHLLFCKLGHDSKDLCKFCARMITYENEHDGMLSTLYSPINSWLRKIQERNEKIYRKYTEIYAQNFHSIVALSNTR